MTSNEKSYPSNVTVEKVKEISGFHIELDVENGYAAAYVEIAAEDAGQFTFRGLNEAGDIVSTKH